VRHVVPPPGLFPGAVRGAAAGAASGRACWAAGELRGALPLCMRIVGGVACDASSQWQEEVCVSVCVWFGQR
jgi:hypothetical protein